MVSRHINMNIMKKVIKVRLDKSYWLKQMKIKQCLVCNYQLCRSMSCYWCSKFVNVNKLSCGYLNLKSTFYVNILCCLSFSITAPCFKLIVLY